ncbi:glutathione S-transferase [Jaminaea rosea]|uniref:Glutathione S-transferase n=1 Tax=Jaminaea rosea TaxID=1569628 RepID=A0A316UPR6_9BASI|nr:glutathione S-transferase [Jaminaea rosea]PWN27289.1 glutathione S-transferase [Jaminaea rosea]
MTITLYYLDNSRAMRVLWAAIELGLADQLQVKSYARVEGKKAVPEMQKESGFKLGKSPFLIDDDGQGGRVEVFESVACIEYLHDRYGSQSSLLPASPAWSQKSRVQSWLAFCETPMTHALPIIYLRWHMPESQASLLAEMEDKLSANVCKDLDLYEDAILASEKEHGAENGYLAGGQISLADLANAFTAEYIIVKKVGTANRTWPAVERWLKRLEARPAYRKALEMGGLHDFSLLDLERQSHA